MKYATGASSQYGEDARDRPGLVLLYAPGFAELAPAYVFSAPELVVGREPTASAICVPEQAVSRQHARFFVEPATGRWHLQDLGSRNGTIVDGSPISEIVPLEPNHEIRIGDAVFKFVAGGAERARGYRLDGAGRRAHLLTELAGGAQIDAIATDIERIAPTSLSVLVIGETGTGKELVARGIHRLSGRGALQTELAGVADGSTLLLDEVGALSPDAQAELLRVLDTRGVRVVATSQRELAPAVAAGTFRGDLLARLGGHLVRLPPLRERKEDLYLLAQTLAARHGRPGLALSFSFMVALLHYDWPFNVRELESCIRRALALTDGHALDTAHLPEAIAEHMTHYGARPSLVPETAPARRGPPTEAELRELLARHRGNIAAVGRELGKERMQVHRWLKKFGIDLAGYR